MAGVVQNPYIVMAGLFDLRPHQIGGQIPFYNQFGRMGEGKFTVAMTQQVDAALANGTIQKTDSAQSIYDKAIAPWIASMGPWQDPNKAAQQALIVRMVDQYKQGQQTQWKDVDGNYPFGSSIQPFGSPPPVAPKRDPEPRFGLGFARYRGTLIP